MLKEQQLDQAIQEFEGPLLRYAFRFVRDESSAHDVVQEAFIKLHKAWSKGNEIEKLSSWLYRVTHNAAVDLIRKEQRIKQLHERHIEKCELEQSTQEQWSLEEKLSMTLEHLSTLDEREQQIILLRLQEGKAYHEIAEIMEISEGNVGYILHHAVKKLTDILKEKGLVK